MSASAGWIASRVASEAPSRPSTCGSPASCCAIRSLTHQIKALEREFSALVAERAPALLELPGCGAMTAATILAETAGPGRFSSDAKLARTAGVAPIPASPGKRQRHRLDRGGNRKLNCALHRIAVTQGRCHPPAIAYLARRQAEGKSRREAVRALKRHLARVIWRTLQAPAEPAVSAPQ